MARAKKAAKKKVAGKKTAKKSPKKVVKKAAAGKKPAAKKTVRKAVTKKAAAPAGVPNIDYSLCQGCGGCAEAYPDLFEMRADRAWVINPEQYSPRRHADIMTICPYYAIAIVKV